MRRFTLNTRPDPAISPTALLSAPNAGRGLTKGAAEIDKAATDPTKTCFKSCNAGLLNPEEKGVQSKKNSKDRRIFIIALQMQAGLKR